MYLGRFQNFYYCHQTFLMTDNNFSVIQTENELLFSFFSFLISVIKNV